MKKRIFASMLAVIMMITTFTACSQSATETATEKAAETATETATEAVAAEKATQETSVIDNETPAEEKAESEIIPVDKFSGTELTIAIQEKSGYDFSNMNEKAFVKLAEEATGIHVNWIVVKQEAAAEKVGVMLASGDLPDAFLGFVETGLVDTSTIAQNADLFQDLSKDNLLETYAPNVLADYDVYNSLEQVTWPDGAIYGLLGNQLVSAKADWSAACLTINKKWLDQLGMEVPTTADEFYNVLCAFRDNDMNGNGDPTDEIPLSFANGYFKADFMLLANSFGIAGNPNWLPENAYKMIEDGKVIPTLIDEKFRKCLEFYNKLYTEGLMDMEGFSQTGDQWNAKVNQGLVGCTYNYSAPEDFVAIPPFEGIEGVTPVQTGLINRSSSKLNVLVCSAGGNVPAVLHWWNYLCSSTEMKLITKYGEEGILWKNENGFIKTLSSPEGVTSGSLGLSGICPAMLPEEEPSTGEPTARDLEVDAVMDYIPTEGFPTRIPGPESVEERAMIELELFDYIKSFIAKSVVEGIDDTSWEAHLNNLESLQYPEWIDWWQSFVDGKK